MRIYEGWWQIEDGGETCCLSHFVHVVWSVLLPHGARAVKCASELFHSDLVCVCALLTAHNILIY